MAQLWGGRFTKETDQLVYNFNASISFQASLSSIPKDGLSLNGSNIINHRPCNYSYTNRLYHISHQAYHRDYPLDIL